MDVDGFDEFGEGDCLEFGVDEVADVGGVAVAVGAGGEGFPVEVYGHGGAGAGGEGGV